jgi:dephospho-CoA kinase
MNNPYLVGITGGIGAGKSIVSNIFAVLGAPVYDADSRAKWLMENDQDLVLKIKQRFGDESYENNKLNRIYLAAQVFTNQEQLQILNNLVHPAVATDFRDWSHVQNTNYVIKEAALLIESGSYKDLNTLIVVTAPENLRLSRIIARDSHRTEKDVRNIMNQQLSDAERVELADYIIANDESVLVTPEVIRLHELFSSKK